MCGLPLFTSHLRPSHSITTPIPVFPLIINLENAFSQLTFLVLVQRSFCANALVVSLSSTGSSLTSALRIAAPCHHPYSYSLDSGRAPYRKFLPHSTRSSSSGNSISCNCSLSCASVLRPHGRFSDGRPLDCGQASFL